MCIIVWNVSVLGGVCVHTCMLSQLSSFIIEISFIVVIPDLSLLLYLLDVLVIDTFVLAIL